MTDETQSLDAAFWAIVARERAEDWRRFESYHKRPAADDMVCELFGSPRRPATVADVLTWGHDRLASDWRERARASQRHRLGLQAYAGPMRRAS